MKRSFLFLLLILGLPFWMCARSSHGKRFYQVLVFALALVLSVAFVFAERLVPLPEFLTSFAKSKLAEWFFISSFLGFIYQLMSRFMADRAVRISPWSTGTFHFWSGWPLLTDVLIISWVLFAVYVGTFGPAHDPISMTITGISAGAFFIVACVGYLNHGSLPLEAGPMKAPKPKKAPRPFLSYLRRMPNAAREDLGAVFSRRDPALHKISRPEQA